MSDEFIIEEEESSGRSRSFITALGILLAVLFAGIACLVIAVVRNGADNGGEDQLTDAELAITVTTQFIETANAEIAAANMNVTKTLEARATNDARPTETPIPTDTPVPPTATATNTPAPTDTPVVSDDDGDGTGGGEGDGDGDTDGGEADATATVTVLTTPIAGGDGGPTATPIVGGNGNSGGSGSNNGELPQTGVSPWGAIIAGLLLVLVLFGARRLRSA